jgi:hypothetical protein
MSALRDEIAQQVEVRKEHINDPYSSDNGLSEAEAADFLRAVESAL